MAFFQFIPNAVAEAIQQIGKSIQVITQTLDTIKSYKKIVDSAWIGSDAKAFSADIDRIMVPGFGTLTTAMSKWIENLNKATDLKNQMEQRCKARVSSLRSDDFRTIIGG
jgi:uncharacterized protein YukE